MIPTNRDVRSQANAELGNHQAPGASAKSWFEPWVYRIVRNLDGGNLRIVTDSATTSFGPKEADLHADLTVNSAKFFRAVTLGGTVGAAESYARGEWDSSDLVTLFRLFARDRGANDALEGGIARMQGLAYRLSHRLSRNSRRGSDANIRAHYDLGNDFFALFLDDTMSYSCGIFDSDASTLRDASVSKNDRLCKKLALTPDDHLLEIGTGWGALALHAARHYGCRVTTTTLSREQRTLAEQRIADAGLTDKVDVRLTDYRDLRGQYHKLVSVEMVEAVGHQFLGDYFSKCAGLLAPDGLMALQAITVLDQRYDIARTQVDMIQRLMFPGSDIPSITSLLTAATAASDLHLVHMEDIGPHYPRTLREWRKRFMLNREQARDLGYDEPFLRLWQYYLCYCEAGFIERYTGDVQMILAKPMARQAPILGELG